MKSPFIGLLWLCCTLAAQSLIGQAPTHQKSIGLSIFDEHVAAPFAAQDHSVRHIGGAFSLEITKKREGVYRFSHVVQLGYYHHKDLLRAGFIAWKPKFEFRFFNLLDVHIILGTGYAHSFPSYQTYVLENGVYKKETSKGRPHFMPSAGFGAGLHLDHIFHKPLEFFVRYEGFGLAPYTPKGAIPLTINTMFGGGVKFLLN